MARVRQFLVVVVVVLLTVTTPVQCEGHQGWTTPNHSRPRRLAQHPHTNLTTPELIVVRDYPVEVHHVITDDGYILELHRIPHGRNAPYGTQHAHTGPKNRPQAYSTPHSTAQAYSTPHSTAQAYSTPHSKLHAYPTPQGTARTHTGPYVQLRSDNGRRWAGQLVANRSLITAGRRSRGGSRGQPRVVFLQHGLFASSADFVLNDPDQALAFLLADAGYDVWMGNFRGNLYSRRHVNLSPEQPEFWDHSWNELARYDLPAMLRYVRMRSGAAQVSYVGHSMGAAVVFAMLNYHPHLNTWIRVMAALAPAAYVHNRDYPLGILSPFVNDINEKLHRARIWEILRLTPGHAAVRSALCEPAAITSFFCTFINFVIHGPNSNYLDREYLPVLLAHWPAGTAVHVFTHLLQLHASRKFQAFDYGEARNLAEYGSTSPPTFSLSHTKLPVGIFWTENDWIAEPLGVQQTAAELPWLALNHQVQLSDFNHMDFLWAENANYLVYRPVMDFLNSFY